MRRGIGLQGLKNGVFLRAKCPHTSTDSVREAQEKTRNAFSNALEYGVKQTALLRKEAFQVNNSIRKKLARGKRKNQYRLRNIEWEDQPRPMFSAGNIKYDLADKTRGLACGGIGGMHLLARQSGLIDAIDRRLHLLKIHKPYHESDHVLNIAYNLLCGGQCLEHIELRRNDEVFADALGAQRTGPAHTKPLAP